MRKMYSKKQIEGIAIDKVNDDINNPSQTPLNENLRNIIDDEVGSVIADTSQEGADSIQSLVEQVDGNTANLGTKLYKHSISLTGTDAEEQERNLKFIVITDFNYQLTGNTHVSNEENTFIITLAYDETNYKYFFVAYFEIDAGDLYLTAIPLVSQYDLLETSITIQTISDVVVAL